LDLFNEERSGFRLKRFEFYNWGTFDKNIWIMDPQTESSLLTGANGSGKTTIVDALTTLLVPATVRHYNQSSGAEKKRERTEESYVLGACGNIREEEKVSATVQYLRDRNGSSIIIGIFENEALQSTITLAQIRRFSGNNLKKSYLIIEKELSIQKDFFPLDIKGLYRKNLREKGARFYDSFNKYSLAFISLFGMRSTKALNLFSQIVGVKVLGDLNEFIRTHMLEKSNMEELFSNLYSNYENLLRTRNMIEKAEAQLTLLNPILKLSDKQEFFTKEQKILTQLQHFFPLFSSLKLKKISLEKLDLEEQRLNKFEVEKADYNEEKERINRELSDAQAALATNKSAEQLRSIEKEIAHTTEKSKDVKNKWKNYKLFSSFLHINAPESEKHFIKNQKEFQIIDKEKKIDKNELENSLFEKKSKINSLNQTKSEIDQELLFLRGRKTNIPLKNGKIRDTLASILKIKQEDLPFIGECLSIKENEKIWEPAIEKLLHSFALCLLVPKAHYDQLNRYVSENNLRGKLVYFKAEGSNSKGFFNNEKINDNSILNKLIIKPNSPYHDWIYDQLVHRFDYICTDNLDLFKKSQRALTSSGLIKNRHRHEKDDRKQVNDRSSFVLGWDNLSKRAFYERQLESLLKEIKSDQKEASKIGEKLDIIENDIRAINRLLEFKTFSEINWFRYESLLSKQNESLAELLNSANDLKKAEARVDKIRKLLTIAESKIENITLKIGGTKQQIETINIRLKELTNSLDEKKPHNNFSENEKQLIIENLESRLNLHKTKDNLNLSNIENALSKLSTELLQEWEKIAIKLQDVEKKLIRAMDQFIRPKDEYMQKYPGWHEDCIDLNSEIEFISDFRSLQKQIAGDDLPSYKNQFCQFLNDRAIENLVGFNQSLYDRQQEIEEHIFHLNQSLRDIKYQNNPPTYIQIEPEPTRDIAIREFRSDLKNAYPDAGDNSNAEYENQDLRFQKMKKLLVKLKENDIYRKKVLDVRNWLNFAAVERFCEDETQKQYYADSQSLSGGEKAKLAYTILASAISYQFGIKNSNADKSFRFVVIDEAFSKIDPRNSAYAMNLFKKLDLQLMVVTPMDRINLVEEYIRSVHFVNTTQDSRSHLSNLSYEKLETIIRENSDNS